MTHRALPILPLFIVALSFSYPPQQSPQTVWLSSLDISKMQQGWGQPQADKSVTGKPISIAGRVFERGVGTHAVSKLWIKLQGGSSTFTASVGVDDSVRAKPGSAEFK